MRLLFVKSSLAWPRSAGHDVHSYHMMRALAALGHSVGLLSAHPLSSQAVDGLNLDYVDSGPRDGGPPEAAPVPLTFLQEKFRSYWGIGWEWIERIQRAADQMDADAVIAVGLEVLPFLAGAQGRARVWYAGDEWCWHHFSQLHFWRRESWPHAKEACIKGLYERAYASLCDRIWVVSEADRRAMRLVTGARGIDVLPNGVDAEHFAPLEVEELPQSCIFWGRLDFGPNLDALDWFTQAVWPELRRRHPEARLSLYGFQPTDAARSIAARSGASLTADLPDLRAEIARHQVVILPFVSGGGIKNKLLEAAALAKPIVVSPVGLNGLRLPREIPMEIPTTADAWIQSIERLWAHADRRRSLGLAARQWVRADHSWESAARTALAGLEPLVPSSPSVAAGAR